MIRLAIRCRRDQADAVLAELSVLAPNGVEERDLGEHVEYAVYGAEGELPDLGEIDAGIGGAIVDVESSAVPDDWETRWQRFHRPVTIADRVFLRPPWAPAAGGDLLDVTIDPGQAFGTGAHATTRLCLELLLSPAHPASDRPVTDLGSGSGVLAICARKLGFGPAYAYDNEEASVKATLANAEANGVELSSRRWDLRQSLPELAPLTFANLLAPLLIDIARSLTQSESPDSLICSGILDTQVDDVLEAFADAGYVERDRRSSGEWVALDLFRRSNL